jgi:hypothetical protein
MPPLENRTVGGVARELMGLYIGTTTYVERGGPPDEEIAAYVAVRKGRPHCATWYALRLQRACGSTMPIPDHRLPAVLAIRDEIKRLPDGDRLTTLLWMRDRLGCDANRFEADLIAECERAGPEKLMLLLSRHRLCDDPDLDPRSSDYHRVFFTILGHAPRLLRAEDAAGMVSLARVERYAADWFIAAARLRPARAAVVLDEALESLTAQRGGRTSRLSVALARWRLVPGGGTDLVVNHFYAGPREPATFSTRRTFLHWLQEEWSLRDRKLLVALLNDKRFDSLDWPSLERLVLLVNKVEEKTVVNPENPKFIHPLGTDHVDWPRMEAEKKYPKETAELRRHLARWRDALRKHFAK